MGYTIHIDFDIILGSIIGTVSYLYFNIKRERNLHPQRMNRNNSFKKIKINHIKKQQLNNQYKSNQRIHQICPRIKENI